MNKLLFTLILIFIKVNNSEDIDTDLTNMKNMLNVSLVDILIPDIKSHKNENVTKMLDVVKDMEYNRICALIGDYKMNGEEWQVELANKITEWFKNGGLIQWLEYQYQKEYGVTVDEYLMEDSKELVEV